MAPSIRPEPVDPVADYLAKYGPRKQQAAQQVPAPFQPADPVDHYLQTYKPDVNGGNAFSRGLSMIGDAASNAVHHPGDTFASLVEAPVRSLVTAMSPGVGESRHDPRLSKGGNSSGRAIDTTPYDAEHGGVTPGQRTAAGLQTVANVAFPGIVSRVAGAASPFVGETLGRAAGLATAGGVGGAAYTPNDPLAGAVAGGLTAPAMELAGRGVRTVGNAAANTASKALDIVGRPATPTPVVQVAGRPVFTVQSAADRAADLNAKALRNAPSPDGLPADSPRPVAPMDVAGTAGVRLARALKTTSPGAEGVMRTAIGQRDDNAVSRVIDHGLEATGLKSRDSAVQLVDDLIQQRSAEADAAWPPMFERNPQAINDPRIAQVLDTDSGARAYREVPGLMSDRFLKSPATPSFDPASLSPDKAKMYSKILAMNGGDPEVAASVMRALGETPAPPTGPQTPPMNLQQLHYWAKALDDLGEKGYDRGPGQPGNRYNKALGAQNLASIVRRIAKDNSSDYATLSQKYADRSDLVRGAQLGGNLFNTHPAVAAQAMADLPVDAQDVFRRAGFDALAERVENGPADVERGVSKPRDQQRMRLLFPDDASFNQFRHGLAEEAQLHANGNAGLGGSNTTDKLADIADMAGVPLPDILRTMATGRWHQLAGRMIANAARKAMAGNADALSTERMRLLMAGANGDPAARATALARMSPPSQAAGIPETPYMRMMRQAVMNFYGPRALTSGGPYMPPNGGQQP